MNEEAGRLLLEKYEDYFKHAKLMTSIHANKDTQRVHENENVNHSTCTIPKIPEKVIETKRNLRRL